MYRRVIATAFGRSHKRAIRYSIVAANVALLLAVLGFVLRSPSSNQIVRQSSALASETSIAVNPLDQLSSADIAVHVARLTRLDEATSVVNQADSVNSQLSFAPANDTAVTKPQIVATALKSKNDVKRYVTVAGDTVAALATRFSVTSDSIKWSNGLASDSLSANQELYIPPVNGIVYVVKAGDTVDTLAQKFRASRDQIIAANDAEVAGLKAGDRILIPDGSIVAVARSFTSSYSAGYPFGFGAVYGYNGYDYGYCTWWVAKRRADIGRPLPTNLGNACTWATRAVAVGIGVGDVPAPGAAIMTKSGCLGHVGFVEEVLPDGSIWVSDMNSSGQVSKDNTARAGGWGRVSWRHLMPSEFGRFKFIY